MRSLAETENVRRRLQREVDTAKQFAMQGFCKDLLEIADTLGIVTANAEPKDAKAKPAEEAAAKRTPEEVAKAYEDLLEALRGTNSILRRVFAKHGLQSIEPAAGTRFDPALHHAVFLVPLAVANGAHRSLHHPLATSNSINIINTSSQAVRTYLIYCTICMYTLRVHV